MLQPVKQFSLEFVSDNASTVLTVDLSLLPIAENFQGAQPQQVLSPSITATGGVVVPAATYALTGTTLTVTFATAPPEFDTNNALVTYTLSFLLAFAT